MSRMVLESSMVRIRFMMIGISTAGAAAAGAAAVGSLAGALSAFGGALGPVADPDNTTTSSVPVDGQAPLQDDRELAGRRCSRRRSGGRLAGRRALGLRRLIGSVC